MSALSGRRWLPLLAMALGAAVFLQGAWIPAKAWLAQRLLERGWEHVAAGAAPTPPWPGADMVPVARLRQPRLGVDQVVLSGVSGRVLAFGPGHLPGTGLPGADRSMVLAGHRDTHFRWLQDLVDGDLIVVRAAGGRYARYRVEGHRVVDADDAGLLQQAVGGRLHLVTCWPFDALTPGGHERYVVSAVRF